MKQYYSVPEFAKEINKSRQWVYFLVMAGRVKATKVGKTNIIHKDELNRFIKTR